MKVITRPVLTLGLLAHVCCFSGCGYKFVDGRGVFGPDVNNIEIRMFENLSREVGFQAFLSDALVEEFMRRGDLKPAFGADTAVADLVMNGVVKEVKVSPSSFSSVSLALEDTIEVTIDVYVKRSVDSRTIWSHRLLQLDEQFLASADPNVYESNKEQAMRRISAEFAGRIHDELFERF